MEIDQMNINLKKVLYILKMCEMYQSFQYLIFIDLYPEQNKSAEC